MGYAVRMSLSPCTLTLPVLLGLAVGLNSSAGWGMLAGGICFLPFAQPWAYTVSWDIGLALSYAFVILLGTVFSFWAYIASVKYIRPAETSIIGALEPLSSILFSFLVFHMAFGAVELIGMFLIILAVYIVSRP